MCGIAGMVRQSGAAPGDPALAAALAAALRHRGPDGNGAALSDRAVLAHTRLAIIDIAGSDQPFVAGGATLIANAEIYNYRALRAALPDAPFATGGDCEPALHLWLRHGDAYAQHLRGMYAIAVLGADATLTLSRDPFGIKPLYHARIPDGFAFASEPRALLETGLVSRTLRQAALHELLMLQFTTGAETIFPGISRVLPGETLRIENGTIAARSRIAALPDTGPETITEDAALARLDAALMESVALHLQSDVPYGMFLSGGIDSTAILACMARLATRPLAFTAGFDAPGAADEREVASTVARAAGARHETMTITKQDCWRHLPEIVACMDDPAADYAIIPSWFLARRAAADVKVVLSGEGGDEIFAGYGRHRHASLPWWRGGRRMRGRGALAGLGILRATPAWRDGIAQAEQAAAAPGRTKLQRAQATDIADWLPHDLLLKLDRCLMAHGVEGRTPLLDTAVTAASFRLPDALKIRGGQGKYLLRRWLAGALPQSRPFAPKQGFTVPVGAWIAEDGARLGALVAAQPVIAALADPAAVRGVFARAARGRAGMAAWLLLFTALWHRAHIEAVPAEGDVFAYLARK